MIEPGDIVGSYRGPLGAGFVAAVLLAAKVILGN